MQVTDAVNEVILHGGVTNPLAGLEVNVKKNIVTLRDEFGLVKQLFTPDDPDLLSKVRRFWGDFLADRSRRRLERLYKEVKVYYEVRDDDVMPPNNVIRYDNEEDAQTWANKYPGWKIFRMTEQEIEVCEPDPEEA